MAENVKRKKKKRAVLIVLMALVLAVLAVVCVYETELNKLDSNDGVDNSFYDSQFKNKKVMVIVPHEDDDLGLPGVMVPIEETIRGFNAILDGEVDNLPEQAFLNVGTIDDAIAKGKKLLEAAKG